MTAAFAVIYFLEVLKPEVKEVNKKWILTAAAAVVLFAVTAFAQEAEYDVLKFKDADIRVVLKAISEQASRTGKKINIVATPEVTGAVSIDLVNVDWETALNVLLKANNYAYYRYRNVITVASPETVQALVKEELDKETSAEVETLKVYKLKYIDANDARKAIEPLLSKGGKASVLETKGQSGWSFGNSQQTSSLIESKGERMIRAKTLIVTDTRSKIAQISNLIDEIDVMASQILIKAKIMEVNRNRLEDIGFNWGSGPLGASGDLSTVNLKGEGFQGGIHSVAQATPSTFLPKSTGITTDNSGLKMVFQHLTGTEFEVILNALEEDGTSDTLASPTIVTLNNQEASILIGTKFPIIKTDISTQTNYIIGGSLQEYKDIGIQLNVVPQIWGEKNELINMIVHPVVSSFTTTEKVISQDGTVLVQYPIISTREAETQLVVRDGETVAMGGLLKDVKTSQVIGIPILRDLPLIGSLFRRKTESVEKIDLLIFITAQIIKPEQLVPEQVADVGVISIKEDIAQGSLEDDAGDQNRSE